ncbi:MAG: PaaI family thioesterase [Candidatus Binatia bacterium]
MGHEAYDDVVARLNATRCAVHAAMGFDVIRASGDEVIMEYLADGRHHQDYGIVHGGVHCAVVEAACSIGAGLAAMPRGQGVVGVENHTSFVRAVRTGRVRVTALPIARGRRSQLWEATARNDQGEIVATGRVRFLCLETGSPLAGEALPANRLPPRQA